MNRLWSGLLAAVLVACAKPIDAPSPDPTAEPGVPTVAGPVATADALAHWMQTDRETVVKQIGVLEFRYQRSLLAFSGLEESLGGAQAADAALRGLMLEMKPYSEEPRELWWRTADDGEPSGTLGLGMSVVQLAAVALDFKDVYGDGKAGKDTHTSKDGSVEIAVADGTISYVSSTEGTAGGLNGKFLTQMKVNVCPDASGKITLEATSTSSLSKVGGSAGANTTVKVVVTRYLDNDAQMRELDVHKHTESAVFGGDQGSFVDMDTDISTRADGKSGASVNRRSSKTTDADVATAGNLADILSTMAISYTELTRSVWERGGCVKLEPTTVPSKRKGVKPGTTFRMLAPPRSRVDGSAVGGTVRGTLSGEASLDPSANKIAADATFTYIASNQPNKAGTVTLESRSRRGVVKVDVGFSTAGAAYSIEGGADDFHGTGKICDLSQPFTVTGSGNVVTFEPSSAEGGSYTYQGTMSGFAVFGNGTYTVKYADEVAVSLTATGPGSVKTPSGTMTRNGTEQYVLVLLEGGACE